MRKLILHKASEIFSLLLFLLQTFGAPVRSVINKFDARQIVLRPPKKNRGGVPKIKSPRPFFYLFVPGINSQFQNDARLNQSSHLF